MLITFSPTRLDTSLTLERYGDTLILNGEAFDFSQVTEGSSLPRAAMASDWFAGDVTRKGGQLQVPLILPHGADASRAERFPSSLHLTTDGPVTFSTELEEVSA